MSLAIYSIAAFIFILLCLVMLWPINAASRRVRSEIRQLQRELVDGDGHPDRKPSSKG